MRCIELNLPLEFAARIGKNSMQAMVMAQFTTFLGNVIYFKSQDRHTPAGALAGRRADPWARAAGRPAPRNAGLSRRSAGRWPATLASFR
jgi:hypothetical protein